MAVSVTPVVSIQTCPCAVTYGLTLRLLQALIREVTSPRWTGDIASVDGRHASVAPRAPSYTVDAICRSGITELTGPKLLVTALGVQASLEGDKGPRRA